jgi:hypothetical protein
MRWRRREVGRRSRFDRHPSNHSGFQFLESRQISRGDPERGRQVAPLQGETQITTSDDLGLNGRGGRPWSGLSSRSRSPKRCRLNIRPLPLRHATMLVGRLRHVRDGDCVPSFRREIHRVISIAVPNDASKATGPVIGPSGLDS